MVDVRVVDTHVGAHFCEFANDDFRAAVTSVTDVLTIAGAAEQDFSGSDLFAHIAEGIADQFGYVQAASVIDVYCFWCDFENVVLKAEYVLVCPVAESSVFWEAVSANTGAWENHVVVGRAHFYSLDYFYQVNAVSLREQRPLIEECEYCSTVGILDDFCCFRFDWPVHDGQWEVFGVEYFVQELFDPCSCLGVYAGTHPPEIAYG